MSAKPSKPGRVCVVLGGRGFVGSAIVAEANARGWSTVVVGRDTYDASIGSKADVLINANGNSKKYLAARDPKEEFDLSTRSVLRSLHDFKVSRYVHLSTIDVYPDRSNPANNAETAPIVPSALSPYGFHKHLAEELVRFYAPSWLILRMGGFVGRGLKKNSIYDLLKNEQLRVSADSEYQYLHTQELARTVFDLIDGVTGNDTFNVCGDGTISLRDIAWMIPNCDSGRFPQNLPPERYEVNVDKLKKVRPVPSSRETVRQFVHDVLAGKEKLA